MTFKHFVASLIASVFLMLALPLLEYSLAVLPFTWQHTFATSFTSHPILLKGCLKALYFTQHPTWQKELSLALLGQGKVNLIDVVFVFIVWGLYYTITVWAFDGLSTSVRGQYSATGILKKPKTLNNKEVVL